MAFWFYVLVSLYRDSNKSYGSEVFKLPLNSSFQALKKQAPDPKNGQGLIYLLFKRLRLNRKHPSHKHSMLQDMPSGQRKNDNLYAFSK